MWLVDLKLSIRNANQDTSGTSTATDAAAPPAGGKKKKTARGAQ